MDEALLGSLAEKVGRFVTLEDNVLHGGFGAGVLENLSDMGLEVPVRRFGLPDAFVNHGTREELFKELGLDPRAVASEVRVWMRGRAGQEITSITR